MTKADSNPFSPSVAGPSLFQRTLASISDKGPITPFFEQAIMRDDWPQELPIKVRNRDHNYKFSRYFHPSTDLTLSEAQLYWKWITDNELDYPPIGPSLAMTFMVGNLYHALIQSMLIHLGFSKPEDIETSFRNEDHKISGRVDVLNCTLPDGKNYLIDIKSIDTLPPAADIIHQNQVRLYLLMGSPEPRELGSVLYIEKRNPHRVRDFLVLPDPTQTDPILQKFRRVREAVEFEDPSSLTPCSAGQRNKCPARGKCNCQ